MQMPWYYAIFNYCNTDNVYSQVGMRIAVFRKNTSASPSVTLG
jgi:hypothetical protein